MAFSDTVLAGKQGSPLCYCQVEVEFQVSHLASKGKSPHYCWVGVGVLPLYLVLVDPMMGVALSLGDGEVLTHHQAFSDNTLAGRVKHTSIMPADDRSPGSPCGLHWHHGQGPQYYLVELRVLPPYLAFSDATLVAYWIEHFITVWGRWKCRLFSWPLLAWVEMGPMFFLGCLAGVEHSLSKIFLFY